MVYTKPVYCITVHKTSLQYKCTENHFTLQVYRKLVYISDINKTKYRMSNYSLGSRNGLKTCLGSFK